LAWFALAWNPSAVRFVTKDHTFVICTQSGANIGLRDDGQVHVGHGPCPEEGGEAIVAVQTYQPWLLRFAVLLTWLGLVASIVVLAVYS
jgi:hypothetical protein